MASCVRERPSSAVRKRNLRSSSPAERNFPTRLIDCESLGLVEGRRVLRDDPDQTYAILSHTWGHHYDDITYKKYDAKSIASAEDEGSRKIRNACRQARQDGHSYIWIDSSCVNRDSEVELSRSINAMYNWYAGASICYAYLEDIADGEEPDTIASVVSRLKAARWFTRGWTLQELLAPRNVCFYSSGWKYIGSLRDWHISRGISQITRIDHDALKIRRRTPISQFSAAQKFSWTSRRETSELEDEAYCLVGICDVKMSYIAGEGRNAFVRLQKEILKAGDESVFVWDNVDGDEERTSNLFARSPRDYEFSWSIKQSSRSGMYFWETSAGIHVSGDLPLMNMPGGGGLDRGLGLACVDVTALGGIKGIALKLELAKDTWEGLDSQTMDSIEPLDHKYEGVFCFGVKGGWRRSSQSRCFWMDETQQYTWLDQTQMVLLQRHRPEGSEDRRLRLLPGPASSLVKTYYSEPGHGPSKRRQLQSQPRQPSPPPERKKEKKKRSKRHVFGLAAKTAAVSFGITSLLLAVHDAYRDSKRRPGAEWEEDEN